MEKFKDLSEIMQIDPKHLALGRITGSVLNLELFHEILSEETLNASVPEEIQGQFNVARNMAVYTYYFYALAPEVHLKTYTLIEHALKLKAGSRGERLMLKRLVKLAVNEGWIADSGFRHIEDPSSENEYCKSLIEVLPDLRNSKAHGSTMLVPDCVHHVKICADFINQLFPQEKISKKDTRTRSSS